MLKSIVQAVHESEQLGLYKKDDNNILSGFSGDKLVGSLQRLAALYETDADACYLEVGVFRGLTLLSVANACPKLKCYGIDNFQQFDPDGENLSIVIERASKLNITNKYIINKDYEDALESLSDDIKASKIAVYFIDGPHDYRSQLMCLELALPYLHKNAVIVIDDANYEHVRQANRDFLTTHPKFKLVFESYTKCHPRNMTKEEENEARQGWWNGINIIVRDEDDQFATTYPSTQRNRIRFENDHLIHSSKFSESLPQILALLSSLSHFKILSSIKNLILLSRSLVRDSKMYKGRHGSLNTYSNKLPKSNYTNFNEGPQKELQTEK